MTSSWFFISTLFYNALCHPPTCVPLVVSHLVFKYRIINRPVQVYAFRALHIKNSVGRCSHISDIGWSSSYTDNGLSTTLSYTGNCLSTTMVVPPPTETMVYQPHSLFLFLQRHWFINHVGWSSSYTDDDFINHTICSSSYKDNGLSTTLDGPPPTQPMLCQPHCLFLLLHIQRLINHVDPTSSCTGKDLATSCASTLVQTKFCQPQYRVLSFSFLLRHILTHSVRILKDYPLSFFKSRYRTQG